MIGHNSLLLDETLTRRKNGSTCDGRRHLMHPLQLYSVPGARGDFGYAGEPTMPPRVGAEEKLNLERGVFWRMALYGLSPSRHWSIRCLKRRRTTKLARMAKKHARVCPVTQHGKNRVSGDGEERSGGNIDKMGEDECRDGTGGRTKMSEIYLKQLLTISN